MYRLTRRDLDGDPFLTPCDYKEMLERLAAYEDTGLEPEEIQRLIATNQTHAKNHREMFEELAKYKQAEAEGRLIVLPCKVGGDLWVKDRDGKPRRMILDVPDIRCHCAKEDNLCAALCDSPQAGVCAYRLKNDGSSFGKTIFLTREEAEKALKEEQV